jgi:hypothetical protein
MKNIVIAFFLCLGSAFAQSSDEILALDDIAIQQIEAQRTQQVEAQQIINAIQQEEARQELILRLILQQNDPVIYQ